MKENNFPQTPIQMIKSPESAIQMFEELIMPYSQSYVCSNQLSNFYFLMGIDVDPKLNGSWLSEFWNSTEH